MLFDIEDLPAPTLLIDDKALVVKINAEARLIFNTGGRPESELVGKPLMDLVVAENKELGEQRVFALLNGLALTPSHARWRIPRHDGETFVVHAVAKVFQIEGRNHLLSVMVPADEHPTPETVEALQERMLNNAEWIASSRLALQQLQEQMNIHSRQLNLQLRGLEIASDFLRDLQIARRVELDMDKKMTILTNALSQVADLIDGVVGEIRQLPSADPIESV